MPILADKTVAAIDAAIEQDGGAAYRVLLRAALEEVPDAFSPKNDSFRKHLGASMIGRPCAREIWYGWHWVRKPSFSGRMLRLFNRGHLEEARFIALLRLIGVTVWNVDEKGKQFRISGCGGHFGGSLDSVLRGIPEMPDIPVLGEYKTHNTKSFANLKSEGVMKAKWEHYVQMNVYASAHALTHSLYLAVNKDTDELYGEIVPLDREVAERYHNRAKLIIDSPEPPDRINANSSWYQCKFCDHSTGCHSFTYPEVNCRTCAHSTPKEDGWWGCERGRVVSPECEACQDHIYNPTLLNGIEVISADAEKNQLVYKRKDGVTVDTSVTSSRELFAGQK